MKSSAVFQSILKIIKMINLPPNWFSDPNKTFVGFYKLGSFKKTFLRNIEKQLVLTEGTY